MKQLKMALLLGSVGLGSLACSAGGGTEEDGLRLPEDLDGGDGLGCDGECKTGDQLNLEEVRTTCESSKVGKPVLRRLTQGEAEATLREVFALDGWLGVKLSPDPTSDIGFTNDAAVLVVGGATAKELLKTGEDVAKLVVAKLGAVLPCSEASADDACVEEFLDTYGKRLFRRPLTEEEVTRYTDYQKSVAERSDFQEGIKWMLTAMIQSPHAIYRSEIGEIEGGTYQLGQYEMASEISYMMVGTAPDDALLARAAAGELSSPEVRRAEAVRLLAEHPRKLEGLRVFFNEWLKYRTVLGQSRTDDPEFAEKISPLMVEETRYFLDTLVYGDGGTFADLMTAKFTALNPELAAFYGYGAPNGVWERVERPAEWGMGLLAQGSLLVSTAHQSYSSPTLRGLMMTERFLCDEAPMVPAVVPTIESTNEGKTANTTREKYEQNHASPGSACGNCHLNFEPWGYTFEHFDELGRYRETEDTFPVDSAVDNAPLPDGTTASFQDLNEVSQMVESGEDFQNCASGMLASYMFSGAGGTNCLSEEDRAKAISGQMSIKDYLIGLVAAPHFSSRKR